MKITFKWEHRGGPDGQVMAGMGGSLLDALETLAIEAASYLRHRRTLESGSAPDLYGPKGTEIRR